MQGMNPEQSTAGIDGNQCRFGGYRSRPRHPERRRYDGNQIDDSRTA